ncbi:peroxiredoxin family protein [Maribacter aestuarii]|uniref:peroxiredoxin family protein n=1 Tax=Maribacter aestuarii TaxID=1130723 RepID=UPI00248D2972|nr:TlpA disulfide reductase family protein [Maribacter aestuarii]
MKRRLVVISCLILVFGCKQAEKAQDLKEGVWQARLDVMDGQQLPFNFEVFKAENGDYSLQIFNADEKILVDEIDVNGDSIWIRTPVFEGYIAGTFSDSSIKGKFIKESLDRIVPFHATHGMEERFSNPKPTTKDISGIWETEFSPDTEESYMGKGIFTQKGQKVSGTFRTTTGDYRFLEGVMDGDSLKLSAFDGAHAFLFAAQLKDSILNGTFYSGNHFKEPFVAFQNADYELPSPDSLTFLKEGYDKLDFLFPNSEGEVVSLNDDEYRNKVVIVQIMGTWCPNCLDETKFLVDYLDENNHEDLKVIGLAFEYAKTEALAFKSIQRLTDRIGVEYPILLAQFGTSDKDQAQEKLPMLNHVLSYPTTIFLDKKGEVRRIHTGFNGPATGDAYIEFKKDFDSFLKGLLAE